MSEMAAGKFGRNQRLIEIDELSSMLGVSKNTLYDWCAVKKIPHIKLGKFLRFSAAEIEAWLQAKRVIAKEI
ncbi:MAG: helix-turn-helix domain-containing protein [Candidatus Omnitrophota bacterium]